MTIEPHPAAPIPIYVGGHTDAALRRAARLGDGWIGGAYGWDELAHLTARLRTFLADAGRSDEPFEVIAAITEFPSVDLYRRAEDELGVTATLCRPLVRRPGDRCPAGGWGRATDGGLPSVHRALRRGDRGTAAADSRRLVVTEPNDRYSRAMAPRLVTDRELVDRLSDLFRRVGYDGASLGAIAMATGLQKSSLYHRFPGGKQQMAAEASASVVDEFAASVLAPIGSDAPLEERVAAIAANLDRFYDGGTRLLPRRHVVDRRPGRRCGVQPRCGRRGVDRRVRITRPRSGRGRRHRAGAGRGRRRDHRGGARRRPSHGRPERVPAGRRRRLPDRLLGRT